MNPTKNLEENTELIESVIKHVAELNSITPSELKGRDRKAKFTYPRQMAQYVIYSCTECSTYDLGRYFGKSHTNILRSVNKIRGYMDYDKALKARIEWIIEDFYLKRIK